MPRLDRVFASTGDERVVEGGEDLEGVAMV